MSDNPLVTAIIIFLNPGSYFQEAIESVFAQTYPHWELLLVDDGSTDDSSALAQHYARPYPERVRYLEHPGHVNRGMSATRNLGLRHARGEYVALLDADDVWLPHKLAQQVPVLQAHPEADMVYAPTQYWHTWTEPATQNDVVPELGIEPNSLVRPPTLLVRFLQNKVKPPGTCSVLMRRAMMERVGGFVESFRGMYEDQAFFAKVCSSSPVFVIGEHSARYRQHPASAYSIARATGQQQRAEDIYLTWLARYLSTLTHRTGPEWKTLDDLLWPCRHPLLFRLKLAAYEWRERGRAVAARWLKRIRRSSSQE
jgi:glycosyltransferase involved in cell wall biosynthesis